MCSASIGAAPQCRGCFCSSPDSVIPIGLLGGYSLMHDGAYGRLAGPATLRNYAAMISDPFYLGVLGRTLALGGMVTFFCAALAYPLAYFLAHTRSRWRGALTFLMIMPLMISSVIRNIGWLPVLGDHGVVNVVLLGAGLVQRPLALMNNMTGVVIGLVHALLPFMTLMLLTVMQAISREVEDAARALGASPWRCFLEVVFPLSRRGLAAGCALVFRSPLAPTPRRWFSAADVFSSCPRSSPNKFRGVTALRLRFCFHDRAVRGGAVAFRRRHNVAGTEADVADAVAVPSVDLRYLPVLAGAASVRGRSSLGREAILAFPPESMSLVWYSQISPQLVASLWVSLQAALATTLISASLGIWIALVVARGRGSLRA